MLLFPRGAGPGSLRSLLLEQVACEAAEGWLQGVSCLHIPFSLSSFFSHYKRRVGFQRCFAGFHCVILQTCSLYKYLAG